MRKRTLLHTIQIQSPMLFIGGLLTVISGLFFSRAAMSIGMMLMFMASLLHLKLLCNARAFLTQRSLLLMTGYFFVMAISFFWSENLSYYLQRVTILLPFLVLPFAFFSFKKDISFQWVKIIMLIFIVLVLIGDIYSIFHYLQNKELIDEGYRHSKMIPTLFGGDHIRYSIAVVVAIAFCLHLSYCFKHRWQIALFLLLAALHAAFLHLLSAKTGLVSFYLLMGIHIIFLLLKRKTIKYALILIVSALAIPVFSYFLFKSFRNKLYYIKYSYNEMQNEKKQTNVSDEGRIISYQYAVDIAKHNLLTGVGLGDVFDEMDKKYKKDFPSGQAQSLLPHNQFLMVLLSSGIFGFIYMILFQLSFLRDLLKKNRLGLVVFCILGFAMLVEPLFETQYGACLYCILLLFTFCKETKPKKMAYR